MKLVFCLGCFLISWLSCGAKVDVPDEEKHGIYWKRVGQQSIHDSLRLVHGKNAAKNVILFLGDGMGITTVTATRIYKGQKNNKTGEDELLAFDKFPYVSLSKTYGVDRQTSDSANTATAFLCGVKANFGTLGVDGRVVYKDCESSLDKSTHIESIAAWAQKEDKWAGVVTSTRVTHATPAALYSHSACRDWESTTPDSRCTDIAHQLVNDMPGKDFHVILGGGLKHFIPEDVTDVTGQKGVRKDSRNLLDEWMQDKKSRNLKAKSVYTVEELREVKPENIDYLLGLFNSDHMPYVADRPGLDRQYPTLVEMTEMAIKILSKNPKGFVLLVEGGRIDQAHHMTWAMKSLEEGVEFDKSVESAIEMTDVEDTLVVVTADHSHTFSIGGDYQPRGSNILGLGGVSDVDNQTFTILGYGNGPGYKEDARKRNLTEAEALDKDFKLDAIFPMKYETHGAEDVSVYARGPMAHLFHGVHDQSYIPYVMGYASCVGPNQELCNDAWSAVYAGYSLLFRFIVIGMWTYCFGTKLSL